MTGKNIVKSRIALLTLAAGLSVGGTGVALADQVVLGALMPITGGLQSYGQSSLNGIRLAVAEANAAGGIRGKKVVLKVGDTQTKPQSAIDAAKKLVSLERARGLIGALASGSTIPISSTVAVPSKIPQITGASTAPAISTLKDNDLLFRTIPSDAYQGIALAKLVKEKGVGKTAIIYINNDYGVGLTENFEKSFTALGGVITGKVAYEPNKASYRGELQKLSKGRASHLLVIAYPDNGGMVILKQSLEEGFFGKFIFSDGMKSAGIIKQLGAQYLNGSFGTVPQAVSSKALESFKKAYKAKFSEFPPKPYIDSAYDATMIMMLAMEKVGSKDGDKIKVAIRSVATAPGYKVGVGEYAKAIAFIRAGKDINYEGAAGSHEFDKNGDVEGTIGHWEIQGGKIKIIKVIQ